MTDKTKNTLDLVCKIVTILCGMLVLASVFMTAMTYTFSIVSDSPEKTSGADMIGWWSSQSHSTSLRIFAEAKASSALCAMQVFLLLSAIAGGVHFAGMSILTIFSEKFDKKINVKMIAVISSVVLVILAVCELICGLCISTKASIGDQMTISISTGVIVCLVSAVLGLVSALGVKKSNKNS